ncbi:hypothetical protein GF351_05405 [Candidatus Woesearchaeota archaeon]|nr:hypothetical protein [Candidatus Woesearchaeota archaeon]
MSIIDKIEAVVLVRPEAYDPENMSSAKGYFEAKNGCLATLKKKMLDPGTEQLKAQAPEPLEKSPSETEVTLDGIDFTLKTVARRNNPEYQKAFDRTLGFLEVLADDWEQGIRRDNIRTYNTRSDTGRTRSAPFVEWHYLMGRVLSHISEVTEVGKKTEISVSGTGELDQRNLDCLVLPVEALQGFDITREGSAELWHLGRRFYEEVMADTVKPYKEEMEARADQDETGMYWKQLEKEVFLAKSISSPRREPGKTMQLMYKIPVKARAKDSRGFPVVPGPKNYMEVLDSYEDSLARSLKTWKKLEGNIGEMIIFYYGMQDHERVRKEMPAVKGYGLIRDSDRMFVSLEAVEQRMRSLEKDYVANRKLHVHSIVPVL